ncbi:MAG: hypothetical protein KBD14_02955 [Candidatus Pacebacteria bacterium]|nr:hypothetical protein [Candidatus Paceibacterota bacterium]
MNNLNAQFIENTPSFVQAFFQKILNWLEILRLEGVYQAHKLVDYIFLNKTVFYIVFFVLVFFILRYLWNRFA